MKIMKKISVGFLAFTILLPLPLKVWADVATDDLWDISQGNVVTGMSVAGVYPGSDIRNMFGGSFGTIEVGNAIFPDAQIFGPGSVALVGWKTPAVIGLSRFVLSVAADGVYPYQPSTATDSSKYNRSIQGFNLYASNSDLDVYANWGTAIYASGPLSAPLGTYSDGLYLYTIDHVFSDTVSSKYFKAEIIYGSYYTGPRILELDGYGSTPTNPVPAPSTLLLFGTCLAGLATLGRKRRN